MRKLPLLLILIFLCVSCRTGVRAEAGLNPKFFKQTFTQLTTNSNGLWHLVSPTALDDSKYVVIENDGKRKAFYVVKKGQFTALILPISRGSYSFLNPIRDGKVDAEFTSDPNSFKATDPLGWLDGKSGELKWIGEKITGSKVVYLRDFFDTDIRLSTWIVGDAEFDGEKIINENLAESRANYFVVDDGFVSSNRERVVKYGSSELPEMPGFDIKEVAGTIKPGYSTRFHLESVALKLGAEILAYEIKDLFVVFSGTPLVKNNLSVGVTQTPLLFQEATLIPDGIQALQLARGGNFLSALSVFLPTNFDTTGGNYGGQLRTVELAALGGYVDWGRFVILRDQKGLNADDAIAIAKMHVFSGDFVQAKYFAKEAITRFVQWKRDGFSGQGLGHEILARIAEEEGDREAQIAALISSTKFYEKAGDEMRAAEQENRLGQVLFPKDNVGGLEYELLARSRFYHGNSEFFAALTELNTADMYAEAGDSDKALEMVGYARERFVKLKIPAGLNRVDIVIARIEKNKENLRQGMERALELGDEVGAADAAASLSVLDPYSKTRSQLLVTTSLGIEQMTEVATIDRTQSAIASLCNPETLGEVKSQASIFAIAAVVSNCNIKSTVERQKVASLDPLIQAGYGKLASGDLKEATAIEAKLATSLTESLRQTSPFKAAQISLFQAALSNAKKEDSRSKTITTIKLLRKSVAPNKIGMTIQNLIQDVLKYNQLSLGAELAEFGIEISVEQKRKEELLSFALQNLELRYASRDWDKSMSALRLAQPVFENAGENSEGLLSLLALYRGDLLYRTGKSSQGAKSNVEAKEKAKKATPEYQIAAYVLGTDMALSRGNVVEAKSLLAEATRVSTGQSFAKNSSAYPSAAWVSVLHGDIQYLERREDEANKSYANAFSMLKDQKNSGARRIFIKANRGLGITAKSESESRKVITNLEKLQDELRETEPQLVSAAAIALAEIRILSGRPDEAQRGLVEVGLTENATVESACWWGRATALVGQLEKANPSLKRCATFGVFPQNFESRLVVALLGKATTVDKASKVKVIAKEYGPRLTDRQRQRISLIDVISKKKKTNAFKEEKMKVALVKAKEKDPEAVRWAAEAYANFLVESGRPTEAIAFFEEKEIRNAFYEKDETHSAMVRLRMLAHVRALDPIKTMTYGYQVGEALDEGILPDDQAAILIYVAQNDFVLGLWAHGKEAISEGLTISAEAKDRSWKGQLEALAKSFSLSVSRSEN